jgi:acetyl esterase/lipase
MKLKNNIIRILTSFIGLFIISFIVINTKLFKPSLGSRIARMIVRIYIAPAYGDIDSAVPARKALETISKVALLPWGTVIEEISINGMNADRVAAPNVDPNCKKILLYFHGGGFYSGSRNTHRGLVSRISASSGLPVVVPEFRLAPEHKYPVANDDCMAAYKWLLAQGYKPGDIAIAGDSSGGCLALMTLLSLRDAGEPATAASVLISPLTDAVHYDGKSYKTRAKFDPFFPHPERRPAHMARYIGGPGEKAPILSPVRGNLKGLPPMLIQVGNDEILLNDSTRLADRAKQAGVDVTIQIWDNMWHDFQTFAVIVPEAREAIDDIGDFLKKHMK